MSKLLLYFLVLRVILPCQGVSVEEDMTLTEKEQVALDEFREKVGHFLPHDYMNEDIYLVKWLRARNLDVEAAKTMLLRNLKWRLDNRMDEIHLEDFSYWQKKFPFWLDGRDREDRPVGTADIAVWDPRPSILGGRSEELFRFALSVLEKGSQMVREDRKQGRNVTQFTLIANVAGFSVQQHACLTCLPFYIKFLNTEKYYPGMLHIFFILNTPPTFDMLLRAARPVVSRHSQLTWSIHGTNKNEWFPLVHRVVDPRQIRLQFGGTKVDEEID